MNTLETVQSILADALKVPPAQLEPEARLEDLGLDSLDLIDLMFKLEDRFDLTIQDDSRKLVTIKDVVGYIDELVAAAPPVRPDQTSVG